MWLSNQYSPGWIVCVICKVLQNKDKLTEEGQCKDREWCIKACRDPNREWVDEPKQVRK